MTTIRKVLTCLGCVLYGIFAASMLKVLIGVVVMYSWGLDEAACILDAGNGPVATAGGLMGLAIFLRSHKHREAEQLKQRSPNQASEGMPRKLGNPQG